MPKNNFEMATFSQSGKNKCVESVVRITFNNIELGRTVYLFKPNLPTWGDVEVLCKRVHNHVLAPIDNKRTLRLAKNAYCQHCNFRLFRTFSSTQNVCATKSLNYEPCNASVEIV